MSFVVIMFLVAITGTLFSQEKCSVQNDFFQPGEAITYKIHYHWSFIWVEAGEVTFAVDTILHNGELNYHFTSVGSTYKKYDWIYKVRDRYETRSNMNSLSPNHFFRDVNEGGTKYYNAYSFNYTDSTASVLMRDKKGKEKLDTIKIEPCAFDPLSMIYFARCIDFSQYKVNDKIPLTIILDKEIHFIYIRYLGKEKLKLKNKGEYNTIKFSPLLVKGSIFNGGEGMDVWVTDDKNKIPIRIETDILVGEIIVEVKETKGLKYKIEAKME